MQFVIYFLVATPLVLVGLLWASATTPPQPPFFDNTGLNAIAAEAPAAVPQLVKSANNVKNAVADNSDKTVGKSADKKG